jgi:hypothetical protein
MDRKPPLPVCKAFLVCRQIEGLHLELIGPNNCYVNRRFPNGCSLGFFAKLSGGHGEYTIEVQLHDKQGNVPWRDGPPESWRPQSPLQTLDVMVSLIPVFPGPGDYFLVLTANGEELGREPFAARLAPQTEAT